MRIADSSADLVKKYLPFRSSSHLVLLSLVCIARVVEALGDGWEHLVEPSIDFFVCFPDVAGGVERLEEGCDVGLECQPGVTSVRPDSTRSVGQRKTRLGVQVLGGGLADDVLVEEMSAEFLRFTARSA